MQQFKIDLYKSENIKGEFEFRTLESMLSGKILGIVLSHFKILEMHQKSSISFKYIEKVIDEKSIQGNFTRQLLTDLFTPSQNRSDTIVYLIWDFDTLVDEMKLDDLIENWEFIWYDVSDEAMFLLIPSLNRIVFITEWGYYIDKIIN